MSNFSNREVKVQSDYQATDKLILPPQQTDPAPLYHLCLVSVWAGTRPLPPLHVWSPHRSDFAPLGAASSPAFWGSFEHPGHHPRARRDTAHMSCCSLRERQCEGYVKRPWLCEGLRRGLETLTAVFYIRQCWRLPVQLPQQLPGVFLLFEMNLHIHTLYKYTIRYSMIQSFNNLC